MYAPHMNRGHQIYINNTVDTQSKGNLLIMLYDGAIRFIDEAIDSIENKNIEGANKNIIKTQDIVHELMATLKMEAGDISSQLLHLYDFMYHELVQANIKKDSNKLLTVRSLLIELRDTFKKII